MSKEKKVEPQVISAEYRHDLDYATKRGMERLISGVSISAVVCELRDLYKAAWIEHEPAAYRSGLRVRGL